MSSCYFLCGIRETLETPDGGIVCLDWFDNDTSTVYKDAASRPTVLVLPGLTGESFPATWSISELKLKSKFSTVYSMFRHSLRQGERVSQESFITSRLCHKVQTIYTQALGFHGNDSFRYCAIIVIQKQWN